MLFSSNATVNIIKYQEGRDIGLFRVSTNIAPGETVIFRSLSYYNIFYQNNFPRRHYHVFWHHYHDPAIISFSQRINFYFYNHQPFTSRMTYEELLSRRDGKYQLKINTGLKSLFEAFSIKVQILDSSILQYFNI